MYAGIFPDELKIARVVPLFKGGDKNEIINYRPISLLPVISKIFEKLIHKRLISFLDTVGDIEVGRRWSTGASARPYVQ